MMKDKSPSPMSSPVKQPAVPASVDNYLLEVADAVNRTLDLNTLLQRVAEMLKRVIDYEIFAILLLNEKTQEDRKSTRLNSSHLGISYAVFCLKKKKQRH